MLNSNDKSRRLKSHHVEFLIIGGGLSGCTLGYILRQHGLDSIAVEAKPIEQMGKLCAGAVSKRVAREFDSVFGSGSFGSLGVRRIDVVHINSPGRANIVEQAHYVVNRIALDQFCLNRFLSVGGRIMDRTKLKEIDLRNKVIHCISANTGESFAIRYETLIAADGATSFVRKRLTGRRQSLMPALQGNVGLTETDMILDFADWEESYAWYIPQPDETAAVGITCWSTESQKSRQLLRSRLLSFLQKHALEMPTLHGAFIPTGKDILLEQDGVYFIGDAAGLATPRTGAGIRLAILSARKLAEVLMVGGNYQKSLIPTLEDIERRRQPNYWRTRYQTS